MQIWTLLVVEKMKLFSRTRSKGRKGIVISPGMLLHRSHSYFLLLLAGILVCAGAPGSSAYGATPGSDSAASATNIIGKDAKLNGKAMPAGATLFPGDVIRLGEDSTAALRFADGLVLAAPDTELVVGSRGVNLRNGRLQVRADRGESLAISGPFFQVNLAASQGIPSSAEIRLGGMRAQVSAVTGAADLTAAGSAAPYKLHAGETATLAFAGADASPAQGAAGQEAGQISRLLPQIQIDRESQHLIASVSDRVYWNDGLRSGPTGRAHVTLKDGSQLNLGSDSSLRILQHDAQAQQTSLDLILGRLRGKITKMTLPGAKFEIHTPVGVAGLVGTDLSLEVTNDYVELIVFEGEVRFTTLSGQAVSVTAGNKLRISRSGAFEGPFPATPQETQIAKDLTDILGKANQGAVVAATRPITPLVVIITGTAAAVGIGVWQGTRPAVSNILP
jgi:ferric-dicitrate binding protein FerR (iron transport regulator)